MGDKVGGAVEKEDDSDLSTIPSSQIAGIELTLASFASTVPDSLDETMAENAETPPDQSIVTNLRNAETELERQRGYIFTLATRLSESQREVHRLQSDRRAEILAQNSEAILQEEISICRRKYEDLYHQIQHFKALEADKLAFSESTLSKDFKLLYYDTNSTSGVVCDMSLSDSLPEQQLNFPQFADVWARNISGGDLSSLLSYSQEENIPKHKLLAALITAGMFEFVFEPVFPSVLAVESPLLDQYRKQILTQCKRSRL